MSLSLNAIPPRSGQPRRVLVTGAASGLGAALARQLAERGDRVLLTDRHPEPPGRLPAGAAYLRLDVTQEVDWDAARDWVERHWGGVDVVINNAGIAQGGQFELMTETDWHRIIDVNLMGVVRGCQAFVPMMKAQRSGHLVNTASLAGLVHAPMMTTYNTVKAGVVALSETLDHELHPYGITVSAICPSFFRTGLADSLTGQDTEANATARALIDGAPRSADQVAARVIRGMDRGRHIILTDLDGRVAWLAKRLARPVYHFALDQAAARAARDAVARRSAQSAPGRTEQVRTSEGAS